MAKEEKVSDDEIERIESQTVQKNDFIDGIDGIDRSTGGILSAIGKYFSENW